MPPRLIHLRVHSEYSVVDSILTVDGAVGMAAKDGMPALALTDLSNMFGIVKFYSAARKKGIKPILGGDVWVALAAAPDKAARILLLVQNRAGEIAELSSAISAAGGNIIALGTFAGDDPSTSELMFKVAGPDEATLRGLLEPLVLQMKDVRTC